MLKPTISLFKIKYWYFVSYGSYGYRYARSISGWWFINFSNVFAFLDPALLLLVFCIDDLEYMTPANYVLFYFH